MSSTVGSHKNSSGSEYVFQTLVLSGDASEVNLDARLIGGYLFSVEVVTSADDAVTFTIKSGLGTTMCTGTTTAATSGEYISINDRYAINSLPNYTVSGLGSGTLTVQITVSR